MSDNTNIEAKQVLDELREKAAKWGQDSADFKEFEEKTQQVLDAQEEKNQKLVADIAAERKAQEELKERVVDLESALARKGTGSASYKETPEYKALCMFAVKGVEGLDAEQKSLLRTDNDVAGGYLADTEMDNEIIRKITEISPVRQVARVRTVGKKTLEMPKRDGILTARYEGEAEEAETSTSTYGTETVTAHALSVIVPFTYDMMLASDFDIEAEITRDVSEAFAQREGNRFVNGTGVNQPEGFLQDATVVSGAIETAASGVISGDDLINLTGQLKQGYNPMFGFNRRTLAKLRQLKGGDGQYLWQVGLGGGTPNTLAGEPYAVMEDMPDTGVSGNLAVIYADFMRGYTIIDRTGLMVIRDEVTRKGKRIIELAFHKYNTGQVTLAEAFQALKIKA